MPPFTIVAEDSTRHRELWNKVAEELGYKFRWVRDGAAPHQVDEGDLEISPEDHTRFGWTSETRFVDARPLQDALRAVGARLEEKRVRNLWIEKDLRLRYPTYPDISQLDPAEREMLRRLLPVLPLLKELDRDLKDYRGRTFLGHMSQVGDRLGWDRFHQANFNGCSPALGRRKDAQKEFCSPVYYFPNQRPVEGYFPSEMVPPSVTDADKDRMAHAVKDDPMYNPYLAPLTALEPDPTSPVGYSWKKFNQDPRIRDKALKIAEILEEAAATPGLRPSYHQLLQASAATFRNDDPFSNYGEDAAWVKAADGNLEFAVGVMGNYAPMGKIRGAGLILGVERRGEADSIKRHFLPLQQDLEDRLSDLIGVDANGRKIYQARPISADNPVRVVDLLADTAGHFFEVLAYVGPDAGPVVRRGEVKRIVAANHNEAKARAILLPLAQIAIVPWQRKYVTEAHFVSESAAHELRHPSGPRIDQRGPDGARVGDTIGTDFWAQLEESKANLGALVAKRELVSRGTPGFDEEYFKAAQTTYAAALIRQLRFGYHGHGGGAASEFAALLQRGAVRLTTVVEKGRKRLYVEVDYAKSGPANEAEWVSIGRTQALGDKQGAEQYAQRAEQGIPKEFDFILDRITAAGIPVDVEMVYPDLGKLFGRP